MEILLLVSIPVALAWGVVFGRYAGVWGYVIATLLSGTVLGHSFFHVSALTIDRILLVITSGLFGIWYLTGKGQPKSWNSGDWVLAFLMAAMIGTTLGRPNGEAESSPVSKLVFFYIIPAMFYAIGSRLKTSEKQLQVLFYVLAAFGLYLSLTSIAEKMDWRWAIYPQYIVQSPQTEFLGRGRGPLLNPSGNGILICLALSCALSQLIDRQAWVRKLAIGSVPIYLLGILCTMTRCAWMGGGLTLGVCTGLMAPPRLRTAMLVFMAGLASLGMMINPSMLLSFKRDKAVSEEQMRQSAELRPILAMVAWKVFLDHPLTGCGTGQYLSTAKNYLHDRSGPLPLERARPYVQHNIFLALLVENGLISLIPFVVLLGIWSYWAIRIWWAPALPMEQRQLAMVFAGTLVAYLANGLFQDVMIIPMIHCYLFFLAGCVRNAAHRLQGRVVPDAAVWPRRWAPPAAVR